MFCDEIKILDFKEELIHLLKENNDVRYIFTQQNIAKPIEFISEFLPLFDLNNSFFSRRLQSGINISTTDAKFFIKHSDSPYIWLFCEKPEENTWKEYVKKYGCLKFCRAIFYDSIDLHELMPKYVKFCDGNLNFEHFRDAIKEVGYGYYNLWLIQKLEIISTYTGGIHKLLDMLEQQSGSYKSINDTHLRHWCYAFIGFNNVKYFEDIPVYVKNEIAYWMLNSFLLH
jgi:hypothetical protein